MSEKVVEISFTDNENYIIKEANSYANDVSLIEKMIRESESYRFCLLDSYRQFTGSGQLKRINDLDIEMKNELYNQSFKIQPDKVEDSIRCDICRILWLLNFVFEKYFI